MEGTRKYSKTVRLTKKITTNLDFHGFLKDYKILEIMDDLEENITSLVKTINEECSNKVLENVANFIHGKRKTFTGENKNEERKEFIINYITGKYDLIKEEAKFFYEVEEEKTNKYHLRKRRKIIQNLSLILTIFNCVMETDNLVFS